jgi:hypothetical protein
LAPAAYNPDDFGSVPIWLLPRPFELATSPQTFVAPSGTEEAETTVETTCTITLPADENENKNLRGGPGINYEVTGFLVPGGSLTGVGQATDEFRYVWYSTSGGHWIRADVAQTTPGCAHLPQAAPPPIPPTATPAPAAAGLVSSELGNVCAAGTVSLSRQSDGTTLAITIGGTWTASAGTTATFGVTANQFRGEYGDFIRIVDAAGTILARSGESRSLTYTFTADTTFVVEFAAAKNDQPIMTAACN